MEIKAAGKDVAAPLRGVAKGRALG